MRAWNHFHPVRVHFEPGVLDHLAERIAFDRVLLVTSGGFTRRGVTARIRAALGERLVVVMDEVRPNPDLLDIDACVNGLRTECPDAVLAVGGGSSMDTAKALARLLAQPDSISLVDHFRDGMAFPTQQSLPLAAVPTTAGTGSEVTPFATIWDAGEEKKYSLAGNDLYPHMALLDPELSMGLPMEVTIASGLDAISHAFESTWNRSATPVSLALAAQSLALSLPALPILKKQPDHRDKRADMLKASTLAGMAISQTRTALAHSMSYPLTASFGLPHGLACSFTLPVLLRFNAQADDGRLNQLAHWLGYADIDSLADALDALLHELGMRQLLASHIPDHDAVLALSPRMFTPGRADNNLRDVTVADIGNLVSSALGAL